MATYWYYLRNGDQAGPINEATVRQMLTTGQLGWGDFVWNETMPQWAAAGEVPELAIYRPVVAPSGVPPVFEAPPSVPSRPATPAPARSAPPGFQPSAQAAPPSSAAPAWGQPSPSVSASVMPQAGMAGFGVDTQVSGRTVELLTKTRTWVRLLGILAYLGAVFALAGGLFAFVSTMRMGTGAAAGLVALLIYVLVAGFLAWLGALLNRYSSRITAVQTTRQGQALDQALDAQRALWKVIGILAAIGVVINALVLVVLLITFATTWLGQGF